MKDFTIELRAGERIPEEDVFDLEWIERTLPRLIGNPDMIDVYQGAANRIGAVASWQIDPSSPDVITCRIEAIIPNRTTSPEIDVLEDLVRRFKHHFQGMRCNPSR